MDKSIIARLTGGLGNQIFVLAAAHTQASRLGTRISIDLTNYVAPQIRQFELGHLVHSGACQISSEHEFVFREKKEFHYDERIDGIEDGTLLDGFFQSYKYCEESLHYFRDFLFYKSGIQLGNSLFNGIAVHVRRGDYATETGLQYHGVCSFDYYINAVELLRSIWGNLTVRIFSDSLQTAKELMLFIPNSEYEDSTLTPLQTLARMGQSQALVTSNSSFSWWAARFFLNEYGRVVVPMPWLNVTRTTPDLVPNQWFKLSRGA